MNANHGNRLTLYVDIPPKIFRRLLSQQQVEGHTPTVTHRSVRGHRPPPPAVGVGGGKRRAPPFAFDHHEVYPAPADSSSWRLGASASRVFEVWGGPAEGPPEGDGGSPVGAEALLGLARVSLGPFAAFGSAGWRGTEAAAAAEAAAGAGAGAAGGAAVEGSKLAVGVDGPVVVVDPFSGRTVGEIHLYLALGASSTIAALPGPRAEDITAAVLVTEGGVDKEEDTVDGGVQAGGKVNEREQAAEGRLNWGTEQKEAADGDGGANALPTEQEPAALDDSVAGDFLHWKDNGDGHFLRDVATFRSRRTSCSR